MGKTRDEWYDDFQARCDDGLISTYNFGDEKGMDRCGRIEYVNFLRIPENEQ